MAENKKSTEVKTDQEVKKTQASENSAKPIPKKVVMKSFTIDMSAKNMMNKAILYILAFLVILALFTIFIYLW
jgi:hypothetical protein